MVRVKAIAEIIDEMYMRCLYVIQVFSNGNKILIDVRPIPPNVPSKEAFCIDIPFETPKETMYINHPEYVYPQTNPGTTICVIKGTLLSNGDLKRDDIA